MSSILYANLKAARMKNKTTGRPIMNLKMKIKFLIEYFWLSKVTVIKTFNIFKSEGLSGITTRTRLLFTHLKHINSRNQEINYLFPENKDDISPNQDLKVTVIVPCYNHKAF